MDQLQQHRWRLAICAGPLTRVIGQIELQRDKADARRSNRIAETEAIKGRKRECVDGDWGAVAEEFNIFILS